MSGPGQPQRWFLAVELPEPVRQHLTDAVEPVRRRAGEAVRWVAPGSWHLTLVFCGAVDAPAQAAVIAGLPPVVAAHAPMRLGLAGSGRFGQRVLWVGVAGDRSPLAAVGAAATGVARAAGLAVEERPYRPHLTIARGQPGADLVPAVTALADYAGPTWAVEELVLFESQLGAGPGGSARHVEVERFRLG